MRKIKFLPYILIIGLAASLLGCATVSTVNNADKKSSVIYSGTRLNLEALAGKKGLAGKFNTKPPRYPLLDLPGSILLDTLLFPYTMSKEFDDWLFSKGI